VNLRFAIVVVGLVSLLGATSAPALAQKSVSELLGRQATPEGQPKMLLEEILLFGYVENSFVGNLRGAGRSGRNELRFYDLDSDYTFNMAEISVKKDATERYLFGFGLVMTAGEDAQKNHALGIFRDDNDAFPFRNTPKVDLQEAFIAARAPIGGGLTLKGGKFVTLLGYEVIESPNNLNFSRGNLFIYSSPLTHVGALLTYAATDWLSITAGPVVGWDVAKDNNDSMSVMGQLLVTPLAGLTTSLNWITGPEQNDNDRDSRKVLDLVVNYTGIKGLTLGLNVDYGWEDNEASLVAAATRRNNDASWWGWAAYAAYDWTDQLRTALRVGFFDDRDGVRTLAVAPGARVELYDVTATLQYKIWRGLVGRLEYRHDEANRAVFKIQNPGPAPTSRAQDTITVSLHYLFF
jgi:hypothetical protein